MDPRDNPDRNRKSIPGNATPLPNQHHGAPDDAQDCREQSQVPCAAGSDTSASDKVPFKKVNSLPTQHSWGPSFPLFHHVLLEQSVAFEALTFLASLSAKFCGGGSFNHCPRRFVWKRQPRTRHRQVVNEEKLFLKDKHVGRHYPILHNPVPSRDYQY